MHRYLAQPSGNGTTSLKWLLWSCWLGQNENGDKAAEQRSRNGTNLNQLLLCSGVFNSFNSFQRCSSHPIKKNRAADRAIKCQSETIFSVGSCSCVTTTNGSSNFNRRRIDCITFVPGPVSGWLWNRRVNAFPLHDQRLASETATFQNGWERLFFSATAQTEAVVRTDTPKVLRNVVLDRLEEWRWRVVEMWGYCDYI